MKILILGSTGATGQELIKQSLEQKHEVTALARDPAKLNLDHEKLRIVKGSVLDKDLLANALAGKDAVLSALGVGKSLKSKNLISNAASLIIPAMEEKQVRRLVFLSAFGVGDTFQQADLFQRVLFKLFLRNIYADKLKADDQIRRSALDWTLVYPVVLTNAPGTGKYKVGEKLKMKGLPKIPRADVAEFMVREINNDTFIRKHPIIMS